VTGDLIETVTLVDIVGRDRMILRKERIVSGDRIMRKGSGIVMRLFGSSLES
jgi:hypothetical protein